MKVNKLHTLIERIIGETNSIFNILMYNEDMRKLEINKDFMLYSIENLFCYYHLSEVFSIYKRSMEANCQDFWKNS